MERSSQSIKSVKSQSVSQYAPSAREDSSNSHLIAPDLAYDLIDVHITTRGGGHCTGRLFPRESPCNTTVTRMTEIIYALLYRQYIRFPFPPGPACLPKSRCVPRLGFLASVQKHSRRKLSDNTRTSPNPTNKGRMFRGLRSLVDQRNGSPEHGRTMC